MILPKVGESAWISIKTNIKKTFFHTLTLAFMLHSCGNKPETKIENSVIKKTEIATTKQVFVSIEAVENLLSHMGKNLILNKTTSTELTKIYSYNSTDDYGNHRMKIVSKNGNEKLNYNFSFEENKLYFISIRGNTNAHEVKIFLKEKYGDEMEHPNITKISWENLKEFNITLNPNVTNWELNIKPKNYYPGV